MAYSTSYGIHVVEARNRVATYLQDSSYTRWTKHELNSYLQQGAEDFVRRVGFPIVSHPLATSATSAIEFSALQGTPSFTTGETITGSTTLTTGVVTGIDGTAVNYDTEAGIGFQIGETITGGTSGLSGSAQFIRTNYDIPLPENMSKLSHVEVDGKEVSIVTESEIRYLAVAGGLSSLEDTTDKVIKLFVGSQVTVPKWRETVGEIQAVVASSASCEYFRFYPIPSKVQSVRLYGVYRPLHCSDIVPYKYMKGTQEKDLQMPDSGFIPGTDTQISDEDGVSYTLNTSSNTLTLMQDSVATSTVYTLRPGEDFRYSYNIDRQYMDILVFGALERAYLKEHDLRNVEKSDYYRNKKEVLTQDALRTEALNSASLSGGANFNRLSSRRAWPSRSR